MKKYIDAEKLIDMIDNSIAYCQINYSDDYALGFEQSLREVKRFIESSPQDEADLEEIENDAELIANKIMIGVQSNRYHTCVYNTERNDFNHSHLVQAAKRGIELGLNARSK